MGAIPGALLQLHFQNYVIGNLLGSAILGSIIGLKLSKRLKLIIGFGFCGSLTTFSGWMVQSLQYASQGYFSKAIFTIFALIILGLLFAFFGFYLGRKIRLLMHSQ